MYLESILRWGSYFGLFRRVYSNYEGFCMREEEFLGLEKIK